MRIQTISKWTLRLVSSILILMLIATLALYVLIVRTIDQVYGGKAEIVDATQFQVDVAPTAITNVNVLSPNGNEMLSGRTVLIDQGKILSIEANGLVPADFVEIDGQGKYLIPGLTDSHVHLQRSPNDLLLYVANGVTQIRSMGGSEADLILKSEIENGRIGPHYYVSTPSMNSAAGFPDEVNPMPSWFPDFVAIWLASTLFNVHVSTGVESAALEAKAYVEQGHDGVKLYGFLTIDSFRAILDSAEELGVPTVGHIPDDMPLSELRTTKLGEIGHIEELVKGLQREYYAIQSEDKGSYLEYVHSRKQQIASDLAANDVAVQSTLWLIESFQRQVYELETIAKEVELEYANPGIVEGHPTSAQGLLFGGWIPGRNKFESYAGKTPEEIEGSKLYWSEFEEAHRVLLRAMEEAGVTVLAATDANAWLTIAGFSLHDELQALVEAGISPVKALKSATSAPAKIVKNNAGVLDVGRRADMLLLNENPLDDITNTQSIDSVILNGKVLDRNLLDDMLQAVKVANDNSRTIDISGLTGHN